MATRLRAIDRYPWLNYAPVARRRWAARGLGLVILAIAWPLAAVLAWLAWLGISQLGEAGIFRQIYIGLVPFGLIALGLGMAQHTADRLMRPDGYEVLKHDQRAPVVFLRSFFQDALPYHPSRSGKLVYSQERAGWEERIAQNFRKVAPFVAIGRPGEPLPPLGAARLYVHDDHWQEVVVNLVGQAYGVVLQLGLTRGTAWEAGVVLQIADLRRVLLLTPSPYFRADEYEAMRRLTAPYLPIALPAMAVHCDAFMFAASEPHPLLFVRNIDNPISMGLEPYLRQLEQLGPPI